MEKKMIRFVALDESITLFEVEDRSLVIVINDGNMKMLERVIYIDDEHFRFEKVENDNYRSYDSRTYHISQYAEHCHELYLIVRPYDVDLDGEIDYE